jgi:hypothetical protein
MKGIMSSQPRALFLVCAVFACLLYALPLARAQGNAQVPTPQPPIVTVPGTTPPVSPSVASQPAVSVTEVKSPAAPAHYGDQALWALMIGLLVQWLKRSPWFGWITPASSARLKTQFGFLAAFLTAAGIHFAVSGSVLDGGGASLTVSGLSLNAFKDVLWQWAAQEGWYRAVIKEG